MQHLGRNDYRLLDFYTFTDQNALNTRDFLGCYFDAQISTGNHDTIGSFQDFINIIYSFLVFYLGNDLDRTIVFVQNMLDVQYVLFAPDKRVGDEV